MTFQMCRIALLLSFQAALVGLGFGSNAQSRFHPDARGSDTVVVLVHGILGNSDSWGHKPRWYSWNLVLWNELISSDDSLDRPDTFIFEYETRRNSLYSITDFATQLENAAINNGIIDYENVVFLTHSMGGLVVKDLLTRASETASRIRRKTKFVHFFATPSTGASVANLASYLADNKHLGQMLPISHGFNSVEIQNDFLQKLVEEWAPISANIPSYCAYEKERVHDVVAVVKFESATHGCNRRIEGILADHINIVKPGDDEHPSYLAFKAAFLTEVLETDETSPNQVRLADVVAIDTYQYTGSGGDPLETNADEIKDILVQNTILSSHRIFALRALRVGWDPKVVTALNPSLAFLHFSTFETEEEQCNLDERFLDNPPPACLRLINAISDILQNQHTHLVLYTRTGSACSLSKPFFQRAIANDLIRGDLLSRISILGLRADGRNRQGDKEWFETEASKRAVSFVAETLLFEQADSTDTSWPRDICNLGPN